MIHNLEARALATVLAALRCFQHTVQEEGPEGPHANMHQFTDENLVPLNADEIEALIHGFQFPAPPEFLVWGPDNFPTNMDTLKSLDEIAQEAARFVQRFSAQGYYRDASARQIPLVELPGMLRVSMVEPDDEEDDD